VFVTAFDLENSIYERYSESKRIKRVKKFVLRQRLLPCLSMFRVLGGNVVEREVFVRDVFKQRYEEAGLSGLAFEAVACG
jgi:hypothetical protein